MEEKEIVFITLDGKIKFNLDPQNGMDVILELPDKNIKTIKKISLEESKNYDEYGLYMLIGNNETPKNIISIALCRMLNLCDKDFLDKVNAYSHNDRGNNHEFLFYKGKK